jgi:hypothetical protein
VLAWENSWSGLQVERRGRIVSMRPRRPITVVDPIRRVVRRWPHSLKEVVTVGTVEFAALHAAVLETCGRMNMGKGRFDPASRGALSLRARCEHRA